MRCFFNSQGVDDTAAAIMRCGGRGSQKCVVVTGAMLAKQLCGLSEALAQNESDGVVSWLPIITTWALSRAFIFLSWQASHHCVLPPVIGCYSPSYCFVIFSNIELHCAGWPNFAFSYMAQRRDTMEGTYSLSQRSCLDQLF